MVRLFRPLPWLVGRVAVFGITVWLTLGMHRGLLLSGAIRTKVWPWAPYEPPAPLTSQALSDPLWQFVPWMDFSGRELRAGRIPLWNPHQDGGVPLLGNAQSAVGSPLQWPGFLLGVERGWNLTLLAKLLVAFLGTFLWLRDRRRSPPAAVLGALGVALSGPFIAWLAHPHTLTAAASPFLLLFGGRFAESGTRRDAAGLALATYVVLAGGHPESALMAALLAATVVAARSPSVAALGRTGAVAFLGALLAAPLLLPFVEYLLSSEAISGLDRHPGGLPLAGLLRFLVPDAPVSHPIEGAATVSLAVLVLAPIGLFTERRSREALAMAAAVVALVLVAFDSPVSRLLASSSTVYWSRVLLFLPLPLAYLASAGLDALVERARASRTAWRVAFALVFTAAVELLLAARGVHAIYPAASLHTSTPLLEKLSGDRTTFRVLPLHSFLPATSATLLGLDDVRGYDALSPAGWRSTRTAMGKFRDTPNVIDTVAPWDLARGGAALDVWNVKYLLLHPQFAFSAPTLNEKLDLDLEEIYAGPDGRILRNRRVKPRVRVEGARGQVDVERRVPGLWRVTVTTAASGRVVFADPYWPGWRARVDGQEVPLPLRKGDLMAFPIAEGRHEVELSFEPDSFRAGLLLGAVAFGVLGIVLRRLPRS